jgi:type I restriction enzyme S subunit
VAKLDRAQRLIDIDREMLAKYDELIQSVFLEMFGDPVTNLMGWESIELGDMCGVGSSKRVFVEEFVETGIPFYRGTEVGQLGHGNEIKPHLFISEQHYEQLKEKAGVPKVGDLLLPSICHDGRIWRVTNDKPFYFKDGRVLWIKVDSEYLNSEFLRNFMKLANLIKMKYTPTSPKELAKISFLKM